MTRKLADVSCSRCEQPAVDYIVVQYKVGGNLKYVSPKFCRGHLKETLRELGAPLATGSGSQGPILVS